MRDLIEKSLSRVVSTSTFFARNLWYGRVAIPFPETRFGKFIVNPLSRKHLPDVANLYRTLNGGERLSRQKMAILWLLGSRLCLIASDSDRNEVVGMAIYYFNARDRKQGTVHEGYVGLHEAVRSIGLGTFMRRHALENFARSDLAGVSSRVSLSNIPSLKGSKKLGFIPVETYFDPSIGEERQYLVCDFRGTNSLFDKTKRAFH